ncbi:MAG: tRNA-modifying protein YgfZ, partial [Proteobacteria bacterium]|nr:tRNA-modifying protein YgfZ [Pseudomonadota bacterium]
RIEAATVEVFIPQMLNYDLTGHVSFDKGCYTGQEVVARLHYRGKPKRRLFQATMEKTLALQAGSALYSSATEQSSGTVVNSALGANGLPIALIVAPVAEGESVIHLDSPNGPLLSYAPPDIQK